MIVVAVWFVVVANACQACVWLCMCADTCCVVLLVVFMCVLVVVLCVVL